MADNTMGMQVASGSATDVPVTDVLKLPGSIGDGHKEFMDIVALIDSGASGFAYISRHFVEKHGLAVQNKSKVIPVHAVDGSPVGVGSITKEFQCSLRLGDHQESISLDVIDCAHADILLARG